ncbi:MAG: hypothetical protein IJY84_03555 [Clostridia bacterium]|nr:hypothetical protein [Clostridia bacterium]
MTNKVYPIRQPLASHKGLPQKILKKDFVGKGATDRKVLPTVATVG